MLKDISDEHAEVGCFIHVGQFRSVASFDHSKHLLKRVLSRFKQKISGLCCECYQTNCEKGMRVKNGDFQVM